MADDVYVDEVGFNLHFTCWFHILGPHLGRLNLSVKIASFDNEIVLSA